MSPFAVGESVQLNGLLGELHGAGTGTVVDVIPNPDGITALDEYEIVFEGSPQLRLCRFQLTHIGVAAQKDHEHATVSY